MNLFKLTKPAWNLTDEELVERARLVHDGFKPWQKVFLGLWLLLVVVLLLLTLKAVGLALDHPNEPDSRSVLLAYLLGGMAGLFMGFMLMIAVFLNAEVWTMMRIYRIMLSSWDRVKELEQADAFNGGRVTPPPAGSLPP